MTALDGILDELAERLAARVADRLRGGEGDMVAQTRSPLGARRHCHVVKRRVACGEHGAAIIGRRHLLSPQALAEELARASTKPRGQGVGSQNSVRSELLGELSMIKRGLNRD
jgi:hypothetical protein